MNLLKNRVFTTILFTDIIQQSAIWIRNISIMFFIIDITNNDPIAVSTLNFIQMMPMFLLTFIGGIIADKYSPKKLMLLGDFLSFISFVILGILINNGYIIALFLAVLISAIVTQFSYPASQKYFKEYVDEKDMEIAIGSSQLLSSIFAIIGPFLGSYFYFTFGIGKTLIIIAVLFLISLALIITLPKKEFKKIESSSFKNDIKLTFIYIKNNKIIHVFSKIVFIFSFGMGIAINLDIFLVTERLGLDEKFYQFFSAIGGIGSIVGGGLFLLMSKRLNNIKILYYILGISVICIFFEGYSTIPKLTMALQFIDNIIITLLSGYIVTIINKQTNQEYLGKVNGFISTLLYFGMMVSSLLSGIIVKYFSIVTAFSLSSLSFAICFLILYNESKKGLTL